MRKLATYVLCLVFVFAPMTSCIGPLPLAQGQSMIVEIEKQQRAGDISPELAALLIAEIQTRMDPDYSGGIDWSGIGASVGGILIAALSAYTGVRFTRGPAKPLDTAEAELLKELIEKFRKDKEEVTVA